ncbi:MAG TPA: hypothetical protein VFT78_07310 [Hanamia sp.]|jgi:hypothetical protein|nr:hypothetical protein [Hanamia sp.]
MKKRFPRRLFLFLISSILVSSSYSQALPDPGNDPLNIEDTIAQSVHQKTIPSKEAEKVSVKKCPQQKNDNNEIELTVNITEKKGEEDSK